MARVGAIVIGASAGAVDALLVLLPPLPAGFALPVLIVVHVPPERENSLVGLFRDRCRVPVIEAEDKAEIRPGTIHFAPAGYHLLVEADHSLSLSADPPVQHSRPSIDVLFESAADAYGAELLAIVLTGANSDGAAGAAAVIAAGGRVLVQDPAEATAPEMPRAALAASPGASLLPLAGMASYLAALARGEMA